MLPLGAASRRKAYFTETAKYHEIMLVKSKAGCLDEKIAATSNSIKSILTGNGIYQLLDGHVQFLALLLHYLNIHALCIALFVFRLSFTPISTN